MSRAPALSRTFAVAALSIGAAALLRTFIFATFDEAIPYTPFYPAIVASTMYGRRRGGLIAVCLAAIAASFWLVPFGKPFIEESTDLFGLLLFVGVSVLIVALCEEMKRAQARAEAAMREQQRLLESEQAARCAAERANRLKDEFLASVSHELRAPLHAILGWTELLSNPTLDDGSRSHGLEVIERNARAQARLIEDLLDVSRIVSGKMRLSVSLVNPRSLIECAIQTVANAAQAKNIRIVRRFDASLHALYVDPDRFQQVVWNLLSNAIKFSPTDSAITIALQHAAEGVKLQVRDEGCGIAAELLPHVFERFRQGADGRSARQAGLGLGLAIVKSLVELHGGTVEAESGGPGRGATFTVVLPHTCARLEGKAGPRRGRLNGLRVLVVDDDSEARELVCRVLEEQQAQVVTAEGAGEALAAVQRDLPDVIVSDIAMPQQDGYEFLRKLRRDRRAAQVPAVALTARCSEHDRYLAFEAGYELHLSKPIEPRRLADAIADLAAGRSV